MSNSHFSYWTEEDYPQAPEEPPYPQGSSEGSHDWASGWDQDCRYDGSVFNQPSQDVYHSEAYNHPLDPQHEVPNIILSDHSSFQAPAELAGQTDSSQWSSQAQDAAKTLNANLSTYSINLAPSSVDDTNFTSSSPCGEGLGHDASDGLLTPSCGSECSDSASISSHGDDAQLSAVENENPDLSQRKKNKWQKRKPDAKWKEQVKVAKQNFRARSDAIPETVDQLIRDVTELRDEYILINQRSLTTKEQLGFSDREMPRIPPLNDDWTLVTSTDEVIKKPLLSDREKASLRLKQQGKERDNERSRLQGIVRRQRERERRGRYTTKINTLNTAKKSYQDAITKLQEFCGMWEYKIWSDASLGENFQDPLDYYDHTAQC